MSTSTPNKIYAGFRHISATLPLGFCADACLKLRPSGADCLACREACPVQALRVEVDQVELTAACTGCGRCAAACPAGALRVEGFDELLQPLQAGEAAASLRLECRRVPRFLARNALQIPCLGGISFSALIELVARNPGAVSLIYRGWCANCPSGGGKAPMKELVDAVRMVVADVGLPRERAPQVYNMPTPDDLALPANSMGSGLPVARLTFFDTLFKRASGERVGGRTPEIFRLAVETTRGASLASPVIHHTRQRMAASLLELAEQAEKALSAKFFPEISVSGHCALHGVCSVVCPSGALVISSDEFSTGLHFNPELCLACGLCLRHCPTGSLSLLPSGNATDMHPMGGIQLNLYPLCDCVRCGKNFVSHGFDDICPDCQGTRKMA